QRGQPLPFSRRGIIIVAVRDAHFNRRLAFCFAAAKTSEALACSCGGCSGLEAWGSVAGRGTASVEAAVSGVGVDAGGEAAVLPRPERDRFHRGSQRRGLTMSGTVADATSL